MKRLALILLSFCLATSLAWCDDPAGELFKQAQTARNERRFDDALQIYKRITNEFPDRKNDARYGSIDTLFGKAQKAYDDHNLDDAIRVYDQIATEYPDRVPDARGRIADILFGKAQKANEAKNFDEALQLYERIIVEHPEKVDNWFSAQRSIVDMLIKKGDFAEASKAVHLAMNAAPNLQEYNGLVRHAANILSALDKNVDRANQFLKFEETGTGENPMDAVGYPSLPEREKAFATMRDQAGDTIAASRLRAYTFLFSGKHKEALAQFADAFRRSTTIQDLQRTSQELTLIGFRNVRGHAVGIDKAIQFVIFGPNGPDGKSGTPDDLTDPFAEYLPPVPPIGEGGLAGLSADELTALRKLRDACVVYAGDSSVDNYTRMLAIIALHRVNIALDNWGAPGQKDWYLQCVFEFQDINEILPCTLAAARGRALHFGGVYPVLDEISARFTASASKPKNGVEKAKEQLTAVCNELNQRNVKWEVIKPLDKPATF